MLHQNEPALLNALETYRQKVISDVRYLRRVEGKNNKDDRDYPAVIVVGEYEGYSTCGRSMGSHLQRYAIMERFFSTSLCDALICAEKHFLQEESYQLPTAVNRYGINYYFGTCAEDDVANQLLKYSRRLRNIPLNNIRLTAPVRPRTNQRVDYCCVCDHIFK